MTGFLAGLFQGANTGLQWDLRERLQKRRDQELMDRWKAMEDYRTTKQDETKQKETQQREEAAGQIGDLLQRMQSPTQPQNVGMINIPQGIGGAMPTPITVGRPTTSQDRSALMGQIYKLAYSAPGLAGMYRQAEDVQKVIAAQRQQQQSKEALLALASGKVKSTDPAFVDLYQNLTPQDRQRFDWQFKNAWTPQEMGAVPAQQYSKDFSKPEFQGYYVPTYTTHNRLTGEDKVEYGKTLIKPTLKVSKDGPSDKTTTQALQGLEKDSMKAKANIVGMGQTINQSLGVPTTVDSKSGEIILPAGTTDATVLDKASEYNKAMSNYTTKHNAWVSFVKDNMSATAKEWYGGLYDAVGKKNPSAKTYFSSLKESYKNHELSPDDVYAATELGKALYELNSQQVQELLKELQLPKQKEDNSASGQE